MKQFLPTTGRALALTGTLLVLLGLFSYVGVTSGPLAPVDGIVSRRLVDPGSTAVAGQAVVEIIEPDRVWLHVRFDQQRGAGLRSGLPARVVLHTREDEPIEGRVARVEPHADPVTEELLAKIEFDRVPGAAPSMGELAEVTVALETLPPRLVVPRAAIQRFDGNIGVWIVEAGRLRWAPVRTGASDLEGNTQILEGLDVGVSADGPGYPGQPGPLSRADRSRAGTTRRSRMSRPVSGWANASGSGATSLPWWG